jgi:hypothetical protein
MIPFQGLVAFILTVIVLIKLWDSPARVMWWSVLGLFIFDTICTRILVLTNRECGENSRNSNFALLMAFLSSTALVVLCVYALIKY